MEQDLVNINHAVAGQTEAPSRGAHCSHRTADVSHLRADGRHRGQTDASSTVTVAAATAAAATATRLGRDEIRTGEIRAFRHAGPPTTFCLRVDASKIFDYYSCFGGCSV